MILLAHECRVLKNDARGNRNINSRTCIYAWRGSRRVKSGPNVRNFNAPTTDKSISKAVPAQLLG